MKKRGTQDFLNGGGEMGARMRGVDWAATPLGAPDGWPQSLKTIIRVMLDSRFAMWMSWGEAGTFFCNDAYLPTLGLKQDWALGARVDKVWEEIWQDIGPRIRSVLLSGQATWDEGLQLFLRRSGYDEETFHTFSYSPVYDDESRVAGLLCVVVEITDRVIGERRLALLRDLAGCATAEAASLAAAGTCLLDALGAGTLDVPLAALYLDGDGGPQLVGSTWHPALGVDGAAHETLAGLLGPHAAAAPDGRHGTGAAVALRLDGRPRPVVGPWSEPLRDALVFPLLTHGDARPLGSLVLGVSTRRALDEPYRGFLGLVADQFASQLADVQGRLDAQKRVDALAELDRAKNVFFSNASHEFRTPLTLMLGPIEDLLAHPALAPELADTLTLARRNGQRLRKLVNSLLDFSRIEAGRVELHRQWTDLGAFTAELAAVFRAAAEAAGLSLEVRTGPAGGVMGWVDRDMWEKVVLNLLSNALKFTFEGRIAVELSAADGQARLVVQDSGVGIAAHELPRVFERFHRVAGTRSRSQEGSGIGLALVNELVRLHGGAIAVTSQVDAGTRFTVTLPLGEPPAAGAPLPDAAPRQAEAAASLRASFVDDALRAEDAHPVHPPPAPARSGEPAARILVVDDNADMRAYLQRLLEPRWQVHSAANGDEALRLVREAAPDLVLTDMMMPGLDGHGLLQALRAEAATQTLPVIVLSAQAGEEARVAGLHQGADDYLVKPFAAVELIARVEVQLMRARLRQVEDALNKRLADVFRSAPVGVALLRGPQHVFEFSNAVYQQMVNERPLIGRAIREALPELEGQGIFELLDEVLASGKPYTGHAYRVRMRNPATGLATERAFEFVYQPLPAEGDYAPGIAVVALDVSELMAARTAAEAASRAKDEFIAVLGHELRNPLAPIATALQIMKLRSPDVAAHERAVIDRQVKHMTRLVDDLLDVSRIARGTLELRKEPIELASVVEKAAETVAPLFEKMRQAVSVDVPATGLPLMGDPTRLTQVVSNLLTNAGKFAGAEGSIRLEAAREGDEVVLRVHDGGIGMTEQELGSVFDMFVQGSQGIHRPQGGLGLGLTIARNLAGLHGGSLRAASPGLGLGSTFTLRLPLHSAPRPEAQAAPEHAPTAVSRRRVLLVDDIEDVALGMRDLLTTLGHEVLVAFDGPSALRLLAQKGPVDAALLDIGLPVMDGYELAGHLRNTAGGDALRLIAVSGYGQPSDRQKSSRHGFDLHLVKPVSLDDLMKALG